MKNVFPALSIMAILFLFATNTATAQYINGAWEGVQVTQKKPFPKDMTFNWDTRKYNYNLPQGFSTFVMELHLEGTDNEVKGTWRTTEKYGKVKPSMYEIEGSFNPATALMVWQPTKVVYGSPFANTINRTMTLLEDGAYEYFEGRWTAQDGTNGIMFFRRVPPAAKDERRLTAAAFAGAHPDGNSVYFEVEMEQFLAGEEQPKATYTYVLPDNTKTNQQFKYVMREDNVYTFSTEGINGNTDTWKVTVNSPDEIVLEFQSVDAAGPMTLVKTN